MSPEFPDADGRRSFTTSIAYGPTIGNNIALAYLPHSDAVSRIALANKRRLR